MDPLSNAYRPQPIAAPSPSETGTTNSQITWELQFLSMYLEAASSGNPTQPPWASENAKLAQIEAAYKQAMAKNDPKAAQDAVQALNSLITEINKTGKQQGIGVQVPQLSWPLPTDHKTIIENALYLFRITLQVEVTTGEMPGNIEQQFYTVSENIARNIGQPPPLGITPAQAAVQINNLISGQGIPNIGNFNANSPYNFPNFPAAFG